MTFVSYAQNCEDILLWRALHSVTPGFYIDVGAWHPDIDSVTRAFYDRGWRGINIEPSVAGFQRIAEARPRDVNLQIAVGATAGTATFYGFEGSLSGLNTLDPDAAATYAGQGWIARETVVTVETLAEICRQHAPGDIHFLKIDAEGAERAVLEGADFAAFRPWVILVEATEPLSQTPSHQAWEDLVLAGRYGFAWFDGLNRYYIAEERADALAPAFTRQPNVFDNFLRANDTDLAHRIAVAETRAASMQDRATHAELHAAIAEDRAVTAQLRLIRAISEVNEADRTLNETRALAAARGQEVVRLGAVLDDWRHRVEVAERQKLEADAWLAAMRGSTSWRITGPMRRALRLAGRAPDPITAETARSTDLASQAGPMVEVMPAMPVQPARRPVRAVHQFHSGSAVGDAITKAMLLTQDLLRRLGYQSRIFVEHRDSAFANQFHLLHELPETDGYVLVVRHSMGHEALAQVLALPAQKILLYHNVTPPELLEGSPYLQRFAQLGREQLALLRPAVAASLADSEYNAMELRTAGFAPVSVCTLLFDLDAVPRPSPARAAQRGPVFTMLFVGRIAPSKGQMELVAAYAQFRTWFEGESRLVLVGRHDDRPYVTALYALIRSRALDTGAVEVAGLIDDAELERRYAEADLYVSASLHEGFGVPLVEAMARGVPVLALAAGAIPYTVGDGAVLIEDAAPPALAGQMLALARDPARRAALAQRARTRLPRFELDRQAPALIEAVVAAGAERMATPETRKALAANLRFMVAGHVNGTYSLAEVNRGLALALETARPGTVRLIAVEGEVTTNVSGIPPAQHETVGRLLARPAPATGPEVVISQHYPVWVPQECGDLALALFFWEESLVPAPTVDVLNSGFAGVLAPSRSVAKALIDSGVRVPVRVIGQQPNLDPFRALRARRKARSIQREQGAPFTFLHVSSCFPRKGVDVLLAAYARAFRRDDPVRLVIKGFPNPHNTVAADLAARQAGDPAMGAVELIDRDIGTEALLDMYSNADAMVLPTRGEGYNLPAAEAVAAGLPLIVTAWGGHLDILEHAPASAVRRLKYQLASSQSHLSTPFSLWAEPDEDDLVEALREAVRAHAPSDEPVWELPGTDIVGPLSAFAAERLVAAAAKALDVSWITTWDVRCGVAEYAHHLISAIPGRATIFSDIRTPASPPGAERTVIPAWKAGEMASMGPLASAIIRTDPGIVVLQHQPGLLTWDMLSALLAGPALSGRIVCVALHNTRNLLHSTPACRAEVVRALGRISRVVVHTLEDVNRLATLGLSENVTLIPQGTPAAQPAPLLRNLAHEAEVLIGCYGFFLPGKGIAPLIKALALVRQTWPAAKLRLVNAEYPDPLSLAEIETCHQLAQETGVSAAVEFMTGFLEHAESASMLSACDLVVLPYQHSNESSSAAMRSALAAGVPVAVTPLPIFDEAGQAVLRLPGIGAADLARGIQQALADQRTRAETAAAARIWLAKRSWSVIGARWAGMLEGLAASGVVAR